MRIVHPTAGVIVLLTVSVFWLSTAISELSGHTAAVVAVKTAIPWGFLVLIPALAVTGATGFATAKFRHGNLIDAKIRRMPFIAGNGLLILVPCALYLASSAQSGNFGVAFYAIQGLELLAGAINIGLLALNFRDGLKLAGRLRPRPMQQIGQST